MRGTLTEQQILMRQAGYTIKEVARQTGVNETTLAHRYKRAGIKPDAPILYATRTPESLYGVIHKLYWDEGKDIREVARVLGCTYNNIHWHMGMAGIPRRTRKEQAELKRARRDRELG